MRMHLILSALIATAAIGPAASAQVRDSGIPTETQERMKTADRTNDILNYLGLLGLLGLIGLRHEHAEDSYHPTNIE